MHQHALAVIGRKARCPAQQCQQCLRYSNKAQMSVALNCSPTVHEASQSPPLWSEMEQACNPSYLRPFQLQLHGSKTWSTAGAESQKPLQREHGTLHKRLKSLQMKGKLTLAGPSQVRNVWAWLCVLTQCLASRTLRTISSMMKPQQPKINMPGILAEELQAGSWQQAAVVSAHSGRKRQ